MGVLGEFSPIVEQVSIDEAFLDASGTERLFGAPDELGKRIKMRIIQATGITASVGIAANKSVAKIASDLQKPDGLTICPFGKEKDFIAPLPLSVLWGAGKKTVQALENRGMRIVGDVAEKSIEYMEKNFGKWGTHLWLLANGIDERPVSTAGERKSYSEETTFDEDTDDLQFIEQVLFEISDRLARKIRSEGVKGRTITLKIRLEGFKTFTRSHSLSAAVDDTMTIRSIAVEQLRKFDREGRKIRLVGIGVSNLDTEGTEEIHQLELFSGETEPAPLSDRPDRDPDKLLDTMKNRFGGKVTRAAFIDSRNPRR
jgi:DNA polymerase-4